MDELVVRFGKKRQFLYLWTAVCRLSRQGIAYYLGERSFESLQALWWRVPGAYGKKLIYTDLYAVYAQFFGAWQHRPSEKGSGRTSVIEGLNNKWRNRVSGLVRKTVCVQHVPDLERRLGLVFSQHNEQCRHRLERLGWLPLSTR